MKYITTTSRNNLSDLNILKGLVDTRAKYNKSNLTSKRISNEKNIFFFRIIVRLSDCPRNNKKTIRPSVANRITKMPVYLKPFNFACLDIFFNSTTIAISSQLFY